MLSRTRMPSKRAAEIAAHNAAWEALKPSKKRGKKSTQISQDTQEISDAIANVRGERAQPVVESESELL